MYGYVEEVNLLDGAISTPRTNSLLFDREGPSVADISPIVARPTQLWSQPTLMDKFGIPQKTVGNGWWDAFPEQPEDNWGSVTREWWGDLGRDAADIPKNAIIAAGTGVENLILKPAAAGINLASAAWDKTTGFAADVTTNLNNAANVVRGTETLGNTVKDTMAFGSDLANTVKAWLPILLLVGAAVLVFSALKRR